MMWQDIILMVGGFIFSIALLPSILGNSKPARISCVTTGTVLSIYCIVYATLGLWLAFGSGVLTALAWWVLFFQKRT